jgi:hypothetical protein
VPTGTFGAFLDRSGKKTIVLRRTPSRIRTWAVRAGAVGGAEGAAAVLLAGICTRAQQRRGRRGQRAQDADVGEAAVRVNGARAGAAAERRTLHRGHCEGGCAAVASIASSICALWPPRDLTSRAR